MNTLRFFACFAVFDFGRMSAKTAIFFYYKPPKKRHDHQEPIRTCRTLLITRKRFIARLAEASCTMYTKVNEAVKKGISVAAAGNLGPAPDMIPSRATLIWP
jgi:hypothetical protein